VLDSQAWGQASSKQVRHFSEPIITDSTSTMMFPTTYSPELFNSDKKLAWGNYYANIIVYNFKTDTYQNLFPEDTFIEAFNTEANYKYVTPRSSRLRNFTREWIFYVVRSMDFNENGRMDRKDPSILFVSNKKGEGLKSLSPKNECVVYIDIYETLGFVLVKMQRDSNNDGDFTYVDKDFYMVKIDLATLAWGNKIEIR
jgi:hypothetical protein